MANIGKSYLIHALCNLLHKHCQVTATTEKASSSRKGVTIHSLFKLPVGLRDQKDLTGQNLCRLQHSLTVVDYILIDEYSMLGLTNAVNKRWLNDKLFGGKSIILICDPGQLPPVDDRPLYHDELSNEVGEQVYVFRELLSRLCEGKCTVDDWKLFLSCQP